MLSDNNFSIRTEDIRSEDILKLFVPTDRDNQLINMLKSSAPLIIEGSRGTGKSFLLKVAEQQQLKLFEKDKILPVYVSFIKSALINTRNEKQFQQWMLAKISSRILRVLYAVGALTKTSQTVNLLAGGAISVVGEETRLESIAKAFEDSYKNPSQLIDADIIPDIDDFKDAIQDLCEDLNIARINIFFDEAAHIFRPEQQREFFTLFRDLRSPCITCNAAVYPGVTSYGTSFEATHDAQIESLNRDILSASYRDQMRDIVLKQSSSELQSYIEKNGENFDALSLAVNGNPRLLLKTVSLAGRLRNSDVENVLKDFYRNSIWSEHSALAQRYPGHKDLVDWGRNLVEQVIIPDALQKCEAWKNQGKSERTCYFWIHRDVPESVNESLRLLAYTGIITKMDSGVVATRSEVGTRYAINIGCLAAPSPNPVKFITEIRQGLTIKRFTEYGKNYSNFIELSNKIGSIIDFDLSVALNQLLLKPVNVLDLTNHQLKALNSIGVNTVKEALVSTETDFRKAEYIGPVRARQMMNIITAAVLEYLSG